MPGGCPWLLVRVSAHMRLLPRSAWVNPGEIVVHEMERNGGSMVLQLLAESIGEAREPAHVHPHGEVLAFDVRR